jgi:enoyl-[acyl-carrier protein] reductase I
MLEGKRILITGVVNRRSIAFATAERAQRLGAEVILTSFGRIRRMTERAATRLPKEAPVLELDVNSDRDLAHLPDLVSEHWDGVDGVLHAIAHAPGDALGGNFIGAPRASASEAFETSAYSFKALAEALEPMLGDHSASLVGLDFDATVAWPSYDWMGVAKAALESVSRYLARDLGPQGTRVNLISAGPIRTAAAGGVPGFSDLADAWSTGAPLGWDMDDATQVADTAAFLFSDLSRAISGEIIHVDGGFHSIGVTIQAPGSQNSI